MDDPKVAAARMLIQQTDLPTPAGLAADSPAGGLPELDMAREQTLVVGSEVLSFTIGVEAEFRRAIADTSLFAQLAANKQVGAGADPIAFFDAYLATMAGLGWIVQQCETAEFTYKGDGFDVHDAIISVITGFLAPIAGAADAVLKVLKGLREMDRDKPFIKLFDRRSRNGKIGRFQFTYVHKDEAAGLKAEMMAFALNASNEITQVIFFRLEKQRATLRRSLGTLSADTAVLAAIRPNLAAKVTAFRTALIAEADLGDLPQGD